MKNPKETCLGAAGRPGWPRSSASAAAGFTIVELMMVMAITVFILAATSKVLVGLIGGFKQQSKISETGIESVVGLEVLRRDIQGAGHGIAAVNLNNSGDWSNMAVYGYSEAADSDPAKFNDAPNRPPRAIIGNKPGFAFNDSDYLAIKAVGVGNTAAAGKFHTLDKDGNINTWNPKLTDPNLDSNLLPTDYVIVISMASTINLRLVEDKTLPGKFYTQFNQTTNFRPDDETDVRVIYGVVSASGVNAVSKRPRAPFNRADYFIMNTPGSVPLRCAPGTGVLVRAVMSHVDGKFTSPMPLLDCVADLQVVFGLDSDNNGDVDLRLNDLNGRSAEDILKQVKEVKVYILLHEGQYDSGLTFVPNPSNLASTTIRVGEPGFGRDYNLATTSPNWQKYRWRVISVIEKPAVIR